MFAIKVNKSLIKIGVYNSEIKNLKQILNKIKNKQYLKSLILSENLIEDLTPFIDFFRINKSIIKLKIDFNNISEVRLLTEILKNNNTIEVLSLADNNIENIDLLFNYINH